MFNNIGSKIKSLAKITAWIGIAVSIILGLATITNGGIGTIVIGCLSSWIGSLFTYGFGQLIENTDKLVAHFVPEQTAETAPQSAVPAQPAQPKEPWVCRSCGMENWGHIAFCQQCGVSKQWSESVKQ